MNRVSLVLALALPFATAAFVVPACGGRTAGLENSGGNDAACVQNCVTSSGTTGGASSSGIGSSSGISSGGSTGGSASGGSSSGDVDASPIDDAGACKTPATPHPAAQGSIFCGFGTDAGALTCLTGQECCVGGTFGGGVYVPDDCETWGTQCQNPGPDAGGALTGLQVECAGTGDCITNGWPSPANCCLKGTIPLAVAGCPGDYKASGGQGTACESVSGCTPGEVQICLSGADCPASAPYCVGFRWKILEFGYCATSTMP